MTSSARNVFGKPLAYHGGSPIKTGYFRDGYCRTDAGDFGSHSVAGIVTDEFLEFSASQGNDLRTIGLKGGCKWCLCASRWLEAFTAHQDGRIDRRGVPQVDLEATEDTALRKIDLKDLQTFAVKHDAKNDL
ncbi:hypothetical protein PYCC9005_000573 [Savitreella phatthalungensis]